MALCSDIMRRQQQDPSLRACDRSTKTDAKLSRYFEGMKSIYFGSKAEGTCLSNHYECGWPSASLASSSSSSSSSSSFFRPRSEQQNSNNLPTFILSVGLEGAGHHLWTEIMQEPVVDCVWINARHYNRDIGDGVPRTHHEELKKGILEQFALRKQGGKPPCELIYDAEDSFPTGAIRKSGRIFMRPDIVNIEKLHGVLFNVKYLIITRNVTDTAISALRRNFYTNVETELRTVEHTLTYIESALKQVPCHRIFIANYEQALADPIAFVHPLSIFLELKSDVQKSALLSRLSKKGKFPSRKPHKLTQFRQCKELNINDEAACYKHIESMVDNFLVDREFMWPTFAGNGFDYKRELL